MAAFATFKGTERFKKACFRHKEITARNKFSAHTNSQSSWSWWDLKSLSFTAIIHVLSLIGRGWGVQGLPAFWKKKLRNIHFQIKRIFDGIRIFVWRTSPKHLNLWLVRFDPISSVSHKTTIFTKLHLVVDFCVFTSHARDVVYAQTMESFFNQGF